VQWNIIILNHYIIMFISVVYIYIYIYIGIMVKIRSYDFGWQCHNKNKSLYNTAVRDVRTSDMLQNLTATFNYCGLITLKPNTGEYSIPLRASCAPTGTLKKKKACAKLPTTGSITTAGGQLFQTFFFYVCSREVLSVA